MSDEPIFVRGRSPRALRWLHRIVSAVAAILTRLQVRGRENVPITGGVLLVTNHLSAADPPLIFVALPLRRAAVFAAMKYRRNPLFRWLLEFADVIWVDRGASTPMTLKAGLQALQEGDLVGVAPEGTRSRVSRALQPAKGGAAFLALKANVPIVPVALTGVEKLADGLAHFRRTPVTVSFGKPFTLNHLARRGGADRLQAATDEIMCRIAALLPPEYRGVYAEHPRLKELLTES